MLEADIRNRISEKSRYIDAISNKYMRRIIINSFARQNEAG